MTVPFVTIEAEIMRILSGIVLSIEPEFTSNWLIFYSIRVTTIPTIITLTSILAKITPRMSPKEIAAKIDPNKGPECQEFLLILNMESICLSINT
jgi:hypothetical protein